VMTMKIPVSCAYVPTFQDDDKYDNFLQNVCTHLPDYVVLQQHRGD